MTGEEFIIFMKFHNYGLFEAGTIYVLAHNKTLYNDYIQLLKSKHVADIIEMK